jgi:sodium pump decarboxylase gamma subunit
VETENLSQGLQIVGVGVGGVFVNLFVLMFALYGIGLVFGKKKKKKKKPAKDADTSASAKKPEKKKAEPAKDEPE